MCEFIYVSTHHDRLLLLWKKNRDSITLLTIQEILIFSCIILKDLILIYSLLFIFFSLRCAYRLTVVLYGSSHKNITFSYDTHVVAIWINPRDICHEKMTYTGFVGFVNFSRKFRRKLLFTTKIHF